MRGCLARLSVQILEAQPLLDFPLGQAPTLQNQASQWRNCIARLLEHILEAWSATANAHEALASCCELKSLMRRSAVVANSANNDTSLWLAIANAHAALASSCESKSTMHRSAAFINAGESMLSNSLLPLCAAPFAMLASSRAASSPVLITCKVCCTNSFGARQRREVRPGSGGSS